MAGRRSADKAGNRPEASARFAHGLTRKQAEAELRRRIEAGAPPTRAGVLSLEEAGARLVQSLEVQGRKASTLAAYESTLRAHLMPHFGDRDLHRITTEDVEGFVAASRAKGCAAKSIRNYLGALHSIFEFAKVRPNPVTDARKPDDRPTPTRTFAFSPRRSWRRCCGPFPTITWARPTACST